jgi:hypothetical protein
MTANKNSSGVESVIGQSTVSISGRKAMSPPVLQMTSPRDNRLMIVCPVSFAPETPGEDRFRATRLPKVD